MGLTELLHRRRSEQLQRDDDKTEPTDMVSIRLDRIEARLKALGVRVDELSSDEDRDTRGHG